MNPKVVALISSVLLGVTTIATVVASLLPGWFEISSYYETLDIGPFLYCSNGYYSHQCTTINYTGCATQECVRANIAKGFLILGGIFSLFSIISLVLGTFMKIPVQCLTAQKIVSVCLQAFTAISYIISFVLVIGLYSEYSDYPYSGYPSTTTYGPSFGLTVASSGFSLIALSIYIAFCVFAQTRPCDSHSSPQGAIEGFPHTVTNTYTNTTIESVPSVFINPKYQHQHQHFARNAKEARSPSTLLRVDVPGSEGHSGMNIIVKKRRENE